MSTWDSGGPRWSRRAVLRGAGLALGALVLPPGRAWAEGFELPAATREALDASLLVYVSPLHPDGQESRCHGEVWFFVDGGDVVLATGADRWKSRAVGKGWGRARIWVGDFGPVGDAGDRYRSAPSFEAQASLDKDRAAFDRLLASFGEKYPEGWGKWRPRFEKGYSDGSRVVIRYRPVGA